MIEQLKKDAETAYIKGDWKIPPDPQLVLKLIAIYERHYFGELAGYMGHSVEESFSDAKEYANRR